ANQQADRTQHHGGNRDHRHDAVELTDLHFGSFNREIVLGVVGDVAATAQHLGRLIDGLVQQVGIGLKTDSVFVGPGIDLLESVVGNQHAAIFVFLAEATFRLFEHANHLKIDAVDQHVFANRGNAGEKHRRNIFAEHHDFLTVQVVAFADKSTG